MKHPKKHNPILGPDDEPLDVLLAKLRIATWDYLLVGDGSGSTWKREIGWSSVMAERATQERTVWGGMANRGTVNFAEIMAYLQPLEYLATREIDRREKGGLYKAYNVHIVTDSEYCQKTGSARGQTPKKNSGLWSIFDVFKRVGFCLHWHWIRRESCGLNRLTDALSKGFRLKAVNCVAAGTVSGVPLTDEHAALINPR